MPRYDMVEEGTQRATLLRDHLDGWMTELDLCPIDRVSTVDLFKLDNGMSPLTRMPQLCECPVRQDKQIRLLCQSGAGFDKLWLLKTG